MSALPNTGAPAIKSKGLPPFYRFIVIIGLVFLLLIALVGDQTVDEQGKESGYWGEVTATMDWCERNYVVTPYIAEFYNTISNLGFISLSLAGIWFHKNRMFSFIFFSFFLFFFFFVVFSGNTLYFSLFICYHYRYWIWFISWYFIIFNAIV